MISGFSAAINSVILVSAAGGGGGGDGAPAAEADDVDFPPPKRRANPVFLAAAPEAAPADEATAEGEVESVVTCSAARFLNARMPLTFHVTILVPLLEGSAETRARFDGRGLGLELPPEFILTVDELLGT